MLGIHGYWLFVVSGILLNLTPGQDTMFILGRSVTGGVRAGVAAALGICIGSIGHTLLAALGLSAILATSALAFTVVKLAGAAYLIYLGLRLLLTRTAQGAELPATAVAGVPRTAFLQGILTNLLNPKVALFFLALLPQFIDPASEHKTLAFLALGATFITTGLGLLPAQSARTRPHRPGGRGAVPASCRPARLGALALHDEQEVSQRNRCAVREAKRQPSGPRVTTSR
jgi:threonine/homoserine/homoserine lactone efflux protein